MSLITTLPELVSVCGRDTLFRQNGTICSVERPRFRNADHSVHTSVITLLLEHGLVIKELTHELFSFTAKGKGFLQYTRHQTEFEKLVRSV